MIQMGLAFSTIPFKVKIENSVIGRGRQKNLELTITQAAI